MSLPSDAQRTAWIPYETASEADASGELTGVGLLFVTPDTVPSTVFANEPADGYDMVTYFDDPGGPESAQSLSIKLAFLRGTGVVTLDESTIGALDEGRELLVQGRNAAGLSGRYSSCDSAGRADTHSFELDEGTVVFHTRPAVWGTTDGFVVRVEGEVSGETMFVERYWDLGYSSGDMGSGGLYNALPSMFARTRSENDSHCALLVEQAMDGSGDFVARWLDCDGETAEELNVLSATFTQGNGTSAPMQL